MNCLSEDQEQEAVIAYCDVRRIPCVHIPNEGKRSVVYGSRMKRLGLRAGFPDLLVPLMRHGKGALFIEMKAQKGRVTESQKEWIDALDRNGYAAVVCYGAGQAIEVIDSYVRED